jgi:hypothetical protein
MSEHLPKSHLGRNLQDPDLSEEIQTSNENLTGKNFWGRKMHGAAFTKAILTRTDLRSTDLTEANLKESRNLLSHQLGGSVLVRTELPEAILKFEGVAQVKELSAAARAAFFPTLLACTYIGLTLATTQDVQLLRNSDSFALPVLNASLPTLRFYYAVPFLLFAIYCYLGLYLQRLWESLADLPAIFPDGVRLDKKVDPWMLTGLVNRHVPRLRERQPAFSDLQAFLALLLAYWLVPLTLFWIWIRCLRRHDFWLTSVQGGLLFLSLFLTAVFLYLGRVTLRGGEDGRGLEEAPSVRPWLIGKPSGRIVLTALVLALVIVFLFPPYIISRPGLAAARLDGASLGSADLTEVDLRYARFGQADLEEARLDRADLYGADLSRAKNLTRSQILSAWAWESALLPESLLRSLGLPEDHNRKVARRLGLGIP